MAITITLITAAIIALASFELWLFWTLGEREDARRRAEVRRPGIRDDDAIGDDRRLTNPRPRDGRRPRPLRSSTGGPALGRRRPYRAAR